MKNFLLGVALMAMTPISVDAADIVMKSTPAAYGSVARGAQRVPVLHLQATVPCGSESVKISSVTIARTGRGASTDIARIYVLSGAARITRSFSLPSRGEPLTLPLRTVEVGACKSMNFTVAVDFSTTAGVAGEHVFTLTGADAGTAQVTFTTETGNTALNISGSNPSAIVSAELLPILTPITYGPQRTVARLSVQGTGGKDQRMTAITLTNNGSASDDNLQNLAWFLRTGERISDVLPQMQGRTARIALNPGLLLQGRDTKLLELKADIRASRKRTIRWELEEPSDIEAIEVRVR